MEDKLKEIKASKLTWQPDKAKMPVLDHISLELEEGRFYGIIGPNGAGKTSLIRNLLGLLKCSEGEIYLDNKYIEDYKRNQIAKKLAFLPQNINHSVDFTVYEMIAMGREPYRRQLAPLSQMDLDAINEAIRFTDCEDLKNKSILKISGGERQRVMIARTIAQDTPWIILDEPVSSLDIAHQTRLMQLLDKLRNEKKKTIVAILHDINLAAAYCTHLILMKDGQVYKEGRIEEILSVENLKDLYGMDFKFMEVDGKIPYVIPIYK